MAIGPDIYAIAKEHWKEDRKNVKRRLVTAIGELQEKLAAMQAKVDAAEKDEESALQERDASQDALSAAHIALGGDGEWVAKIPSSDPPSSGDLYLDVPELARELRSQLVAANRELERWRHGVIVEGDFICPDSLALNAANATIAERDATIAGLVAALQPFSLKMGHHTQCNCINCIAREALAKYRGGK